MNKNLQKTCILNKKYPTWRNGLKKSIFFSSVYALLIMNNACNSSNTPFKYISTDTLNILNKTQVEERYPSAKPNSIEIPTKGVLTTIKEVSNNEFIVIKEEILDKAEHTKAHIIFLDGSTKDIDPINHKSQLNNNDFLAVYDVIPHYDSLDNKSTKEVIYYSDYYTINHTLNYVLMGSAFGYFMGKPLHIVQNPNVYKEPHIYTSSSGVKNDIAENKKIFHQLRSTAKVYEKNNIDSIKTPYYPAVGTEESTIDTFYYYYGNNQDIYLISSYYHSLANTYIITNFYRNGNRNYYTSTGQSGQYSTSEIIAVMQSRDTKKPLLAYNYKETGRNAERNTTSQNNYSEPSKDTTLSTSSHSTGSSYTSNGSHYYTGNTSRIHHYNSNIYNSGTTYTDSERRSSSSSTYSSSSNSNRSSYYNKKTSSSNSVPNGKSGFFSSNNSSKSSGGSSSRSSSSRSSSGG